MSVVARMMAQIGRISAKKMPFSMTSMFSIQSYDCDWALMSDPRIRSGAKVRKIRPITTRSGQPSRTSAPSAGNHHPTTTGNTPAMRMFLAALAALAWCGAAYAQVMSPPAFNGQGTLSVSTSSVALSTLTLSPNSRAWLMPFNGPLAVMNSITSSGNLYFCAFGGTCTAALGVPLSPGQTLGGINLGGQTTSPSVISDSTATAVAWW